MGLKELRAEIDDEVSTILDADFEIYVTTTQTVPHAGDGAITFPDLTEKSQGAKLIETCVLYIDIRGSTELNLSHKPKTMAKLYTVFVRAMTHVARHYGGHVRGIIGDRVMVIFDSDKCYTNAVNCAVAMNTIAQDVINRRFKKNEVAFGIGIDAGKMLATKTGIRRHGEEQANYRNLVWLGRPANIASKLTDLANKPEVLVTVPVVDVAYDEPVEPYNPLLAAILGTSDTSPSSNALYDAGLFGLGAGLLNNPPQATNRLQGLIAPAIPESPPSLGVLLSGYGSPPYATNPFGMLPVALPPPTPAPRTEWKWQKESLDAFLSSLEIMYAPKRLAHTNPNFASFMLTSETRVQRAATPPILMTAKVWKGFRAEQPDDAMITKKLVRPIGVSVPGYNDGVFGSGAIYPALKLAV